MEFQLEEYLTNGVIHLVQSIAKAAFKNPKASLFFAQYALTNQTANQKRKEAELRGEHIPPFLIASITTKCNLHCVGCYARANHNCVDSDEFAKQMLTLTDYNRIFDEAEDLGISFILLAGGEPFLRPDVLKAAGEHKKILFPVFTNGTLIDEKTHKLLSDYPNLLPVLSIEGNQTATDLRRGSGVYEKLSTSMASLKKKEKIFGCSVTVQKQNLSYVLSDSFVNEMEEFGSKAILYVEYVPVDPATKELAPSDDERKMIADRLTALRISHPNIIFLSFPGDEKVMGGCLAAGRGFFHINAYGNAEPCPFSAYSDCSLKDHTIKEVLNSKLFDTLRNSGALEETHVGGCTLYEQETLVKSAAGIV